MFYLSLWASEVVLMVKSLPANAGDKRDVGSIPGSGDPMEEGMATHSSILTWRIPWTEEPNRLQSIGLQKLRHDWRDLGHRHACTINILGGEKARKLTSNHFISQFSLSPKLTLPSQQLMSEGGSNKGKRTNSWQVEKFLCWPLTSTVWFCCYLSISCITNFWIL